MFGRSRGHSLVRLFLELDSEIAGSEIGLDHEASCGVGRHRDRSGRIERIVDAAPGRGDLPDDIQQIMLVTFNTNDIPIVQGRIAAKGRDLSESWDLLDQKIIGPLSRIPGVGRVNIDGVLPTQASVYLRFDKIMEHDVDVKILLMNNGYLGMVRQWQTLFYDGRYAGTPMKNPDFGAIAGSMVHRRLDQLPCDAPAPVPLFNKRVQIGQGDHVGVSASDQHEVFSHNSFLK